MRFFFLNCSNYYLQSCHLLRPPEPWLSVSALDLSPGLIFPCNPQIQPVALSIKPYRQRISLRTGLWQWAHHPGFLGCDLPNNLGQSLGGFMTGTCGLVRMLLNFVLFTSGNTLVNTVLCFQWTSSLSSHMEIWTIVLQMPLTNLHWS